MFIHLYFQLLHKDLKILKGLIANFIFLGMSFSEVMLYKIAHDYFIILTKEKLQPVLK